MENTRNISSKGKFNLNEIENNSNTGNGKEDMLITIAKKNMNVVVILNNGMRVVGKANKYYKGLLNIGPALVQESSGEANNFEWCLVDRTSVRVVAPFTGK